MKIGFDSKRAFHNKTGLGSYSRNILRILSDRYPEHEYLLYTPSITDNITDFNKVINKPNVTPIEPKGILNNVIKSYWRSSGIKKQLIDDQINIFHGLSNELPKGIYSSNIQFIITIHDLIYLRHPEYYKPIDRVTYEKKARYGCNKASHIVAVSEQTKKDIIDLFGINKDKISVVYQPCDPVFIQKYSADESEKIRETLQLPSKYILTVGTIEERKNALNIVKAMARLDMDDLNLVIVGRKTKYFNKVQAAITQHGLGRRVKIFQDLSNHELAHVYSGAQLMIYPSVYEGFGIPIIEALNQRTPVITTKGNCFSEAGGPNSKYIDHDNVDEIADAIREVIDNDDLRTMMIQKGYEYVQRFNDDVIADEIMKIYLKWNK